MSTRQLAAACISFVAAWAMPAVGQSLIGISIPVDSMDATCEPLNSGVWSVTGAPPPDDIGIGWIVNPAAPGLHAFVLHDHVYLSPHFPDPARAIVTYEYDAPVQISFIDIVQHTNGITQLEVLIGDDLQAMTSVGSAFGPAGDITGFLIFEELSPYRFEFTPGISGKFVQVIVRKTSLHNGWANYRIYPRTPCYPDCELDGDLDVFDYLCFLGSYANQSPYADCEGDGDWDVFDFLCFQGEFAAGCGF